MHASHRRWRPGRVRRRPLCGAARPPRGSLQPGPSYCLKTVLAAG